MSEKPITGPTPVDFFNWMSQFVQPMMEASTKVAPTIPTPAEAADPMAMWKKMAEANEQNWTQFMAQMVATPEFAAGLGRTASSQATMRDAVRRSAQAYLEAANMPSREDLARIAAQIVALDAKVDDLADRVEDTLPNTLDDLAGVPALEARLAALEAKIDRLANLEAKIDRLAALESKIDRLVSLPAPAAVEKPSRARQSPKTGEKAPASRAKASAEDKK